MASGVVDAGARRGGRGHRSVGAHGAGRRARHPVGDCILWIDTPRRPLRRGGSSADRSRATRPRALPLGPAQAGGAPSTDRRRPDRPHALPAARRAGGRRARTVVPRAGRLPHDAVHRRGVAPRHASMTGAWLTDNRDLERARVRPRAGRRSSASTRDQLPPLRATGSSSAPCSPEVAPSSGLPTRAQRGHRHPRPPRGGARRRRDPRLRDAPRGVDDVVDQLPGAVQEDRRRRTPIATVPGLTPDRYLVVNNHETGGQGLQWLRDDARRSGGATCATTS